jgi:hypothetical protein
LPPTDGHWERDDGGVSIISPSNVRSFTTASAWRRRGDDETRRWAIEALARLA